MPSVFYYQRTDSRKASAQPFFLKHISTGFLKTPIQITRPIHPTRKEIASLNQDIFFSPFLITDRGFIEDGERRE